MNKIATTLGLLFLTTTLVACSQLSTSLPDHPEDPVVVAPPLSDIISIQKKYISAQGQPCQQVLTATGDELRCFDGNNWQRVPSIYE